MNTRVLYLYRDGANNKQGDAPVVAGALTDAQKAAIFQACDEESQFIASQVGLPDLQTRWADRGYPFPSDDDHVWSELIALEDTMDASTLSLDLTATDLADRFIHAVWDVTAAEVALGIGWADMVGLG